MQYDPYGEILTSTLPVTPVLSGVEGLTERLFTGQRFDNSSGLYYYNARYYDPVLGRFIQPDTLVPDPLNPQAWNRFSYVYNNPTSYVDPSGHGVPLLIAALIIGASIGGGFYILATPPDDRSVGGFAGACVVGALGGVVGVYAVPIGALVGLSPMASAVLVNAAGGGVAYLAGGVTQNVVNAAVGDQFHTWQFHPTELLASMVFSGLGGAISFEFLPTRGMFTFKQFLYFAPRSWKGVIPTFLGGAAGRNAQNALYRAIPLSLFIGYLPQFVNGVRAWRLYSDALKRPRQYYWEAMPTPGPTPVPRKAPSPWEYSTSSPESFGLFVWPLAGLILPQGNGRPKKRRKRKFPRLEIIILFLSSIAFLVGLGPGPSDDWAFMWGGLLLGGVTGGILLGDPKQSPSHPRAFGLTLIMGFAIGGAISYAVGPLIARAYFGGWMWGLFGIGPSSVRLARWLLEARRED